MTSTATLRTILTGMPTDADGNATRGSRPNTDRMPALQAIILRNGEALCIYCGLNGSDAMAHLIPAGPSRMGYVAGNIQPAHRICNDIVGNANHLDFLDALCLDDAIVSWPALRATIRANRDDIRNALNARGIPTQK